jgi:hypothetical protein
MSKLFLSSSKAFKYFFILILVHCVNIIIIDEFSLGKRLSFVTSEFRNEVINHFLVLWSFVQCSGVCNWGSECSGVGWSSESGGVSWGSESGGVGWSSEGSGVGWSSEGSGVSNWISKGSSVGWSGEGCGVSWCSECGGISNWLCE